MSVCNSIVEIRCDGTEGGDACEDSAAWTDYGTAKKLRARMREAGWQCALAGGLDRCPKCGEQ